MSKVNMINFFEDMKTNIQKYFALDSYTEGLCGKDWEWDGNKTISFPTTYWAEMGTYGSANPDDAGFTNWDQRTGAAQNVGSEINSYTVDRMQTFHIELDESISQDERGIRKMANIINDTISNEYKPNLDKFRLGTWANGAGKVLNSFGGHTLAAKDFYAEMNTADNHNWDIVRVIQSLKVYANNLHVPKKGRSIIISESTGLETALAERFKYNQQFTSGHTLHGGICTIGDMPIVAIPDDYMPTGVKMMMKLTGSTADPAKCHKLRYIDKAVGSFSQHAEALFRDDSFVKATMANGIILVVDPDNDDNVVAPMTAALHTSGSPAVADGSIDLTCHTTGYADATSIVWCITGWKRGLNPKVHSSSESATASSGVANISVNDLKAALSGRPSGDYYLTAYGKANGKISTGIYMYKVSWTATSGSEAATAVTAVTWY